MDSYSDHRYDEGASAAAEPTDTSDVAAAIGTDERRMHVRAYNYWVSLLDGRDYPAIQDLDPGNIRDFGPHSVLLDFTADSENPATPFIGDAIREECGLGPHVATIDDVPKRSLLSRLTDHYMQILANRAPIGFEAEFVNQRGHNICYRGILMPFSSNGEMIDFIYGVINWKDMGASQEAVRVIRPALAPLPPEADEEEEDEDEPMALDQPLEASAPVAAPPAWQADLAATVPDTAAPRADDEAPAAAADDEDAQARAYERALDASLDEALAEAPAIDDEAGLADFLCAARESAEICKQADGRSRVALYRALAMAYDFAVATRRVPADYLEILDDAGVKAQARAPMTPIVKLVFGVDYDKTRLTEFAAALSFAEREGVDFGGFQAFIEAADGGLKGLVAAERKARRPQDKAGPDRRAMVAAALRTKPALSLGQLPTNEEFALVVTRRGADGRHEVVGLVSDEALLERAMARAARR